MKRTLIFSFLFAFAAFPSHAQWQTTIFDDSPPVLAFGVHDTSFFCSIIPPGNTYRDLYRYVPTRGWTRSNTGIDSSQGYITSFASLGRYFFAGMTDGTGANSPAYRTSDNGNIWFDANVAGPVCADGRYVFGTYVGPDQIMRSKDSGVTWDFVADVSVTCFTSIGPCVLAGSKAVYRSTDTGGTWDSVTTPISNISRFAVVGTAIYAANGTQLMVSTDSGAMWSLVSTNFSVSKLATNGTRLFAGGTSGVYLLDTVGTTWTYENGDSTLNGQGIVALGVFDTLLFADFSVSGSYTLDFRSIPQMTDTQKSIVQATHPDDTLSIYPNPASGVVTIISGGTSIYGVSVLNALGEDVLDMPNLRESDITLDLSKIPSGTYFLRIETDNGSVLRKVVVQH